jgi:hypothetical protein
MGERTQKWFYLKKKQHKYRKKCHCRKDNIIISAKAKMVINKVNFSKAPRKKCNILGIGGSFL